MPGIAFSIALSYTDAPYSIKPSNLYTPLKHNYKQHFPSGLGHSSACSFVSHHAFMLYP
jgi:hypothetical protein